MTTWNLKWCYIPRIGHDRCAEDHAERKRYQLLSEGWEPFAVTTHVGSGDLLGHTVWFRKNSD